MNVNSSKALWFKSSYSSSNKDCVEVAFLDEGMIGVRDSKNPNSPALVFTPSESGRLHRWRCGRQVQPPIRLIHLGPKASGSSPLMSSAVGSANHTLNQHRGPEPGTSLTRRSGLSAVPTDGRHANRSAMPSWFEYGCYEPHGGCSAQRATFAIRGTHQQPTRSGSRLTSTFSDAAVTN